LQPLKNRKKKTVACSNSHPSFAQTFSSRILIKGQTFSKQPLTACVYTLVCTLCRYYYMTRCGVGAHFVCACKVIICASECRSYYSTREIPTSHVLLYICIHECLFVLNCCVSPQSANSTITHLRVCGGYPICGGCWHSSKLHQRYLPPDYAGQISPLACHCRC